MGSSASRKPNDRVYINKPLTAVSTSTAYGAGGGGAGGDSDQPVDINNVCPSAFHTKLTDQTVHAGAELSVEDRSIYLATDPTAEVGKLTPKQLKTIETCAAMGIEYLDIHTIADKRGVRHAEFKRS